MEHATTLADSKGVTAHGVAVAVVGEPFGHCRAHASGGDAVLCGDDGDAAAAHGVEDVLVERFGEHHVVVGDAASGCFEGVDGGGCFGGYWADGEYGSLGALAQLLAAAEWGGDERTLPAGGHAAAAAGVADGQRAVVGRGGCCHEAAQGMLVARRGYGEAGDGAQVGDVEGSVVGGAVLAYYACTVDAEGDGQAQQGHVVDYVVVGPLQEAGVNGHEGQHAVFGEAAGEGDGVALGDAYVEYAVGQLALHDAYGGAGGHGGRDGADALVGAGKLEEGVAEDVLVLHSAVGGSGVLVAGAGGCVECAGSVPCARIELGGCVAFAFGAAQVEDAGAVHVLPAKGPK